jgi:two-component system phosphate regulon response regulator PhoB
MRVLIADQDETLLSTLLPEFQRHGHQMATATDVTACQAVLADVVPDVLVLDGQLPEGGCDLVLAEMRDHPALSRVPVVILVEETAQEFDGLKFANVVAWVQKPCEFRELMSKIDSALHADPPRIPLDGRTAGQ